MAAPAKKLATYADIESAPPNLVAEIIHGALVTHPRPAGRHGNAALRLGRRLTPGYEDGDDGPGGWIFISEPEVLLGKSTLVPDLAAWKRERMAEPPDRSLIEITPDWVCEILSPSTERYDRNAKRDIYGEAKVPYLWLLDPRAKILEVFQLVNGRWLLSATFSGDQEVRAVPFDAAPFSLSKLLPYGPSDPSDEPR
jgi:Uma2 family endonuclease